MARLTNVSVVIPTYNRGEKLKLAIEALINSEFKTYEIIIVDDGSTDKTEEIVKEFNQVKYLTQEHLGAAAARNKGGFAARGDLVFFTDSDCMVDKKCLGNLVSKISESEDIAIVGCRIKGVTKGFWAKCFDYSHFHSFMSPKRSLRKFVCGSGFIVRKQIFDNIGGFDKNLRIAEDEDFSLRVSDTSKDLVYLPEAIVYHDHGRNKLKDFLRHPYHWALQGSVMPYLKYKKSRYGKFALRNRWYYLLFSPIISLLVASKIVSGVFLSDPRVIIYFPFIILNKMIWCYGTFIYLKNENN